MLYDLYLATHSNLILFRHLRGLVMATEKGDPLQWDDILYD